MKCIRNEAYPSILTANHAHQMKAADSRRMDGFLLEWAIAGLGYTVYTAGPP